MSEIKLTIYPGHTVTCADEAGALAVAARWARQGVTVQWEWDGAITCRSCLRLAAPMNAAGHYYDSRHVYRTGSRTPICAYVD